MIELENVTKAYGEHVAVRDFSLSVAPGEVVGFLGPNGAGKSTLLKLLATWHAPTAGTATVAGFDVTRQPLEVRRHIGYLAEHNAQWDTMRVADFLDFVGRLHGLERAQLSERRAWVVARCELQDVLQKRIAECSKGFRQRIGVAAALIHDPPVLILDEPTHGLDPLQVVAFRDFVREIAHDKQKAVLFSSHILAEVAAISDRIVVIHRGRLILQGSTRALEAQAAPRDLEALVLDEVRAAEARHDAQHPEARP